MRRHPVCHYRHAVIAGALLVGLAAALPATADHDAEAGQVSSSTQLTPPTPALLQVTGTTNRFNIAANHADVQSVLKAIFEQAHQQFVPDTSVNGEVTLVLTGQPFNVVLASVCKQAFLRYEIDKNGIYQFQRDDQALREGFARIRMINAALAEQLRALGYQLVPIGQAGPNNAYGVGGGFGGGGYGGNAPASSAGRAYNSQLDPRRSLAAPQRGLSSGKAEPDGANKDRSDANPAVPDGPPALGITGRMADQEPLSAYDQLLRDNGLVGIHATRDQPVPITEALKRFSRQANVPILVDPQLQSEHPLRFYGNIVQPLPDALNLLLPAMHLEWRYTGGNIFVTQSPDFGVFFGISNIPKVVYPPTNLLQQGVTPLRSQSRQPDSSPKDGPRPNKGGGG
jgi:hypothetical protein